MKGCSMLNLKPLRIPPAFSTTDHEESSTDGILHDVRGPCGRIHVYEGGRRPTLDSRNKITRVRGLPFFALHDTHT